MSCQAPTSPNKKSSSFFLWTRQMIRALKLLHSSLFRFRKHCGLGLKHNITCAISYAGNSMYCTLLAESLVLVSPIHHRGSRLHTASSLFKRLFLTSSFDVVVTTSATRGRRLTRNIKMGLSTLNSQSTFIFGFLMLFISATVFDARWLTGNCIDASPVSQGQLCSFNRCPPPPARICL